MTFTAGDAAAEVLRRAGIPWVAGVAGESYLPFLEALRRSGPRYLPCLHESSATFLASAYARSARRPVVVAVTRGPGAANAMIGIHEAAQAGASLVMLVGQVESHFRGRQALQEMDIVNVFRPVAKAVFEVSHPEQVAPSLHAALRTAVMGRPGPVVVSVPANHFYGVVPRESLPPCRPEPVVTTGTMSHQSVAQVVDIVRQNGPGILVAGSAFAGGQEAPSLERMAAATGYGILGGHVYLDAVPAGSPFWLGSSTIRCSPHVVRALEEAACVVMLDQSLGDRVTQGYRALAGRLVSIQSEYEVRWDKYLSSQHYVADAKIALRELADGLAAIPIGENELARRRQWVSDKRLALERERKQILSATLDTPIPQVPFADILDALDQSLPNDVNVVTDAGSINDWVTRYLPFPAGRSFYGTQSSSMGFGVPGSIGVQLGSGRSRTVVLTGDGGYLMTGMEMATMVRMGLPITVIVFTNSIQGSIAMHQDQHYPGGRYAIELPQVALVDLGLGVAHYYAGSKDEL